MYSNHDADTEQQSAPAPEESGELPAITSVELDDLLRRRRTRGQRAARLSTLAAVALLSAALILRVAGVGIVPTQTSARQLPVGVALLSNISFGTLTLNGRRLDGPPPQAVTLQDGINEIILAAPPFQTRLCHVTWPDLVVLVGHCAVSVGYVAELNPAIDAEYEIALDFDSADLPPAAAAAALATVNAAIGAMRLQTAVPVGQDIATNWTPRTGAIAHVPAAQLTQAQLSFAPASTPACPTGLCAGSEFIPGFVGRTLPGSPAWMIDAGITYTWRFVTPAGALVGSVTYPADAPASFAIVPDANGDGGWHVWQPAAPPSVVQDALRSTICDWPSAFRVALPGVPSPAGVGVDIGSGIEGCIFDLQAPGGGHAGTLIWRFGVLLAADDPAHARYPTLPLAAAGEVQAIAGS